MAIRGNSNNDHSLIIVESPAKIKTISKFLGKNFTVTSTFGHVKDLPAKSIGVEIEGGKTIKIDYSPVEGKKKVISEICKLAKNSSEVYLASDPDREGEIISFHIGQEIEKIKKDKSKIHRIVFNEITKTAVNSAIENKREVDLKKVHAQQARRILDRWVGYEVSPILWRRVAKGLSAGRVQSVAVLIVCNREEEIVSFKPEESWSVTGNFFKDNQDSLIEALLCKIKGKVLKLKNKDEAEKAVAEIKKQSFSVEKITDKERIKKPLAPFMTSSLQQDAYNKLGFSVDKTMMIAQKLYEGLPLAKKDSPEALITYMRTDSLRLSETALSESRDFIQSNFSKEYLPSKPLVYSKSGAQDAHEAIRPIDFSKTPELVSKYLEPAFAKLYELIWRRALSSQMASAKYSQRTVLISSDEYTFKVTGSTLIFDGFLKVYAPPEDSKKEQKVVIPAEIKEKDSLNLKKISKKQHFTQPPPRYTEASLVKEMEKLGVGRPSTYAATLSTIQKRKYVEKAQKKFSPTELGKAVIKLLKENLQDIINVSFTAEMEEDLDKIASGEKQRDKVLLSFRSKFEKDLKKLEGNIKETKSKAVDTGVNCPTCKKNKLVIRFGRSGEFVGCSGFPDCKFTSAFERDENNKIVLKEKEAPKELEIKCPQCGKNLVEKTGRYGKFAACPGFPGCKYIHKNEKKK